MNHPNNEGLLVLQKREYLARKEAQVFREDLVDMEKKL